MIGMVAVELISRRLMGGLLFYVEYACMGNHKIAKLHGFSSAKIS